MYKRQSLALLPSAAYAGDPGLTIFNTIGALDVSVVNLSGSSDAEERELTVVSSAPEIAVNGQVLCEEGSTVTEIKFLMGTVGIYNGKQLQEGFIWDSAEPLVYDTVSRGRLFSFDEEVETPLTFDRHAGIVISGFDPVRVVEWELLKFVLNGGSVVDFLRTDDVYETTFEVHAVGICDTGSGEKHFYETREVTAYIFYHGDPNITPQVVGGGEKDVVADAPLSKVVYIEEEEEEIREVVYERFEIYDVDNSAYSGLWAGYVTYMSAEESRTPQMAVTSDGICVQVVGDLPEEFESCRTLDGCCAGL